MTCILPSLVLKTELRAQLVMLMTMEPKKADQKPST